MARACGCDLRAILAGAIICWVVVDGMAVAQEEAEVTEDLGDSYLLTRRTTSSGSVIETLLFAGQPIVTEIAVPGPDASVIAGTTGAAATAQAPAGGASVARAGAGNWSASMGSGFGGTLLTGDIVDNYLILHRIRASSPVTHEIYHEGHKVGAVTEVSSSASAAKSAGRNAFAFEGADDRFVVHLTQPDGTKIRATTEHGRLSDQVVERAGLAPPHPTAKPPSQPLTEPIKPSIVRAAESQRLVKPQEPAGRITVEEPAPQIAPTKPEQVPLPRAFPKPQLRPAIAAIPVQTASPSPPENNKSRPAVRPKPAAAAVNAPPPAAATPRPIASAPKTESPARPKSAVAGVARPPPAATAVKPTTPASTTAAPAAKPKPIPTNANARSSQAAAAKPAAKLSRSPPPGTSSQ